MPALPPVAKTVLVKMFFTIGQDTRGLVRFYITYTGNAPTQAQLAAYATTISGEALSQLIPLMATTVKLTEVQCTDLSSATGAVGVNVTVQTGTRAGTALPGATSALENDSITRRYRGSHPRKYWPFGVVSDLTDAQDWTGGFVTAVSVALTNFYNFITGGAQLWSGGVSAQATNVSYYSGFTVVTNPVTGRVRNRPTTRIVPLVDGITAFQCNTKPAYQRRRGLHGV